MRIRDIYQELSDKLNAGKTVNHMYQEIAAFNTREFQEIQQLSSDRPTRAAELLLDFILTENEDFYNCFLDALTKTEQLHVRQRIVLEGLFTLLKLYVIFFVLHWNRNNAHISCHFSNQCSVMNFMQSFCG